MKNIEKLESMKTDLYELRKKKDKRGSNQIKSKFLMMKFVCLYSQFSIVAPSMLSVTICKVAGIKLKLSSIKLNWSSIELNWSSIKLKLSSIELKLLSIELKLLSIELKLSSIELKLSSIELN